jgi:dethiobiotin synthetase
MKRFVVAGIGTNVGKTVVSAVLAELFAAAYWKPVQAGDLEDSDSMKIQRWCGPDRPVLKERFRLNTPASPHLAAALDGTTISAEDLSLPPNDPLIVETAGGLMVPLNDDGLLYLDVIGHWQLPVFLVTRHYLGSINHTLLSLYALKQRGIPVEALIVSGNEHEPSERIFRQHFPEITVLHLPELETLSANTIAQCAQKWKQLPG